MTRSAIVLRLSRQGGQNVMGKLKRPIWPIRALKALICWIANLCKEVEIVSLGSQRHTKIKTGLRISPIKTATSRRVHRKKSAHTREKSLINRP
jgi:hypothetical protein